MNTIIMTLDQHDRDSSIDISNRANYRTRRAVRAVVTDNNGSVPLLHAVVRDYYKLPGGGIDEGEDLASALTRELREEIGSSVKVDEELGQIIEWKDSEQLKQVSYCFVAKLVGDKGQPHFTDNEIAEGFEVVWATDINYALRLVQATADSKDFHVSFMTTRDAAILRAALQRPL